jgi:hypothetical protein
VNGLACDIVIGAHRVENSWYLHRYTVAKKFKEGYTFVRNRFDLVNIFFQGKKYIPLDLRPKKTRAIRKALTPHEASLMTLKETRRLKAFPMRKFAVKA